MISNTTEQSSDFSKINPHLSVVVPAFNEEGNIHKLYSELMRILSSLNMNWEIIFTDDGSSDKTWEEIKSLHKLDRRIRGIRLSRNFGHQYAILAGLSQSLGNVVITMDADLQHPPEMIPKLIEEWERGNKIVHTVRQDSANISFLKKATSKLFYKIFSFLSGLQIKSGMSDYRLLDRQVVKDILHFPEEGFFLRGLVQWVGYPSSILKFTCQNRYTGKSKYTFKKMLRFALTGITSFSLIPLRISIFIGVITSLIAFGEMFYAVLTKIFTDGTVSGWTSTVAILSLFFGILFILLGIIGEYLGHILIEVKRRPRFLISEDIGIRNITKDDVNKGLFT